MLTVARFALAPIVPLAFDEAYYWRWSTHLAWGYLDHPPLVAGVIRLGTMLLGDTLLGVRLFFLIGGVIASWAVWRAVELLFEDRRIAATATLYFNIMLIVSVGTILATPDGPLLVASALLLFCLAKVVRTGDPMWWVAAGIMTGAGCLTKYTALFWLPSILLWLIVDPRMRPALRTPWPWLGAVAAMLVFLPNLSWNASHEWMTFAKQFGRVVEGQIDLGYVVEHLGTEIGMATPVIFVLAWMGMAAFLRRGGEHRTGRTLLGAMVWPMTLYFIYHSFHARVEGNWTGPIFPALAAAAALVAHGQWSERTAGLVRILRVSAVPVGLILVGLIYAQTLFGLVPLGRWDPTASRMGAGIAEIAEQIEATRIEQGATITLTPNYELTGWLSFYSPGGAASVAQFNEQDRWIQEPPLAVRVLAGPLLIVLPEGQSIVPIEASFGQAVYLTTLVRTRGDLRIAGYDLYLLRRSAVAALSR